MADDRSAPRGVRERTREAIRSELSAAAMQSFGQHGYAATTVEAIAAAVGVSERTFFRYFSSKEDAVLQPLESLGAAAAERLATRPGDESPRQALRAALDVAVEDVLRNEAATRTVMQLNRSEPALRRRHLQKLDEWVDRLAAALAERLGLPADSPSARLPCAVVLAAWEKALTVCSAEDRLHEVARELDAALAEVADFVTG